MNFNATSILLDTINEYIKNSTVVIDDTQKKDYRNLTYISDYVIIDSKNDVGFEVYENEIIVYFFNEHYHFEDYTSELEDGEEDYIERAKSFLNDLFKYKICHIEYYKGKTLSSEKYFLLYNDSRKDECIGNVWYGLSKFINPFGKKSTCSTTWKFDKAKGFFTVCQPN